MKKGLFFFYLLMVNMSLGLCAEEIELSSFDSASSWLLPVPLGVIEDNATISLTSNNQAINVRYNILSKWPGVNNKYVRLLQIQLDKASFLETGTKLSWTNNNAKKIPTKSFATPSSKVVYPSLKWLQQALILSDVSDVSDLSWYLNGQEKFANYVTSIEALQANGYPETKGAQWLYDRPQAIYQLFFMTGDSKWLKEGHRLSQFYRDNVTSKGSFALAKPNDVKYLMGRGLTYRYLLTGDDASVDALKRLFNKSLSWRAQYSLSKGFWTERNQAAALNVALAYWELTNDKRAKQRVDEIIKATYDMTMNPASSNWQLLGCPQHTYASHEGGKEKSPACSPWMMALLGDSVWRAYQLTGNQQALVLLDSFGDFISQYGFYRGRKGKIKNQLIPKYLVPISNPTFEDLNPWSDKEHSCDVASLMGKSVFASTKLKKQTPIKKQLFLELANNCKKSLERLYTRYQKKPFVKVRPPRKYGWLFSTTAELPWLLEQ